MVNLMDKGVQHLFADPFFVLTNGGKYDDKY